VEAIHVQSIPFVRIASIVISASARIQMNSLEYIVIYVSRRPIGLPCNKTLSILNCSCAFESSNIVIGGIIDI